MKLTLRPLLSILTSFSFNKAVSITLSKSLAYAMLLFILFIATSEESMAVKIRNRQSGSATMSGVDTDITVTLPQSVNMSTSILLFSYRVDDADVGQVLVGGELVSSTSVEFHRDASGPVVEIEWQVLEFLSGITVYRGSNTISDGATGSIGANVAEGRSWPIISYENNGSTFGSDDMYAVELTDTDATAGYDQLSFTSEAGDATGYWQVVECASGECQVETLFTSITNPATSATSTVTLNSGAGVTTTQTLLFTSHTLSGNMEGDDLIRTELTDATTVTHTRTDGNDINIPTIITHVVEFLDGTTTVQHGTLNFTASAASQTATITSVDLNTVMLMSPGNLGMQGSGGINNADNPGGNWFSFELTNATTITATRAETTNAADVSYQVAEFDYTPPTNWYTFQPGNWSNPNVWTTDPSGNLLQGPSGAIPSTNDNVFILGGDDITLDVDNITVGSIRIDESVDVAATTGHNFNTISGNGRILMSGNAGTDNFPAGDVSSFADAVNGGTVEINGTGITLDQTRTWNNLVVNMANASDDVVQLADITLNGNLTITRGDFQINDNSATARLDLEVNGDVLVDTDGSMSVGTANAYNNNAGGTYGDYHQGFHEMIVHGNFTNNGGVRFTNQSEPDYNTITSSGAVSLVFTGATNNTFSCNSTTDIYNLVIDKGVNQTYEVELNAATKADFALFGDNNNGWNTSGGNGANPETQKALWIKAGTLRLTGNVFIPSLSEGGRDYTIGENAALVLDGPNVVVHNTANETSTWTGFSHGAPNGVNNGGGSQGLYPLGRLQVDDGYWWLGEAEAINFRDESPGVIEVNGGELRTNQIAISSGAGSGIYTFTLTGGIVRIDGTYGVDGGRAMLHLDDPGSVFTMSGGELTIEDVSGHTTNGILITSDPGNINVTGGTVRINNPGGDTEINTTAPFYNFVIETDDVTLQSNLVVLNDFTIEAGVFDHDGNDVEVGGDFTVSAGATYVFDDLKPNTLTLNGTDNSVMNLQNISAGGAAHQVQRFYNLTIDKPSDRTVTCLSAKTGGNLLSWQNNLFRVDGEAFKVLSGTLDQGVHSILANCDSVVNYGTMTVYNVGAGVNGVNDIDSNPNGNNDQLKFASNQGTPTDIVFLTSDNAIIGNLKFFMQTFIVDITSDLTIQFLEHSNGRMNIADNNLKVNYYNEAPGQVFLSGPNVNNMIVTSGNSSDGGLSLYVHSDETSYTFPFGIGLTGAGPTSKYTPATVTISGFSDDGYITMRPVDAELQTTNLSGGDLLSYYWRVGHSDFTTLPTITNASFTYDGADVVGTEANYIAGKVLDGGVYTRSGENYLDADGDGDFTDPGDVNAPDVNTVDDAANIITFDGLTDTGFTLERANYTAGVTARFVGSPEVYYSRRDGNWNANATWSTDAVNQHEGAAASDFPKEGDIAVVGWNSGLDPDGSSADAGVSFDFHRVRANGDIELAELQFNSNAGADARTLSLSRVLFRPGESITASQVTGFGEIDIRYNTNDRANDPVLDITDVGDFSANPESNVYLIYLSGTDGDELLIDLNNDIGPFSNVFPSLRFTASPVNSSADKDNFIRFEDTAIPAGTLYDVQVNGDLIIDQRTAFLLDGNINVDNTTYLGARRDGELIFTNGPDAVTFTTRDIIFGSDIYGGDAAENRNKIFVQAGGGNDVEHTLRVSGDITWATGSGGTYVDVGSEFDLTGDSPNDNDVVLELIGSGDHSIAIDYDSEPSISNGILSELELYKIVLSKGTDQISTFTIADDFQIEDATATFQPVELLNGTLVLDATYNGGAGILLANGSNFLLPNTANPEASSGSGGLEIQQGTVRVEGNDTGIVLDGLLRVSGGTLDLDDATNNGNNFIQYTASGSVELEVSAGTLTVGSQIRRSTANTSGILKYRQTGGTAEIGTQADDLSVFEEARGVFEVLNGGSEFTLTGGDFTIMSQNGTTPTVASLLLAPTSSSVTGSTINLGGASTPASQTIGINSTIPLNDVVINTTNSPTVQMQVRDLTINGNLTLNTGTELDANGLGLLLGGNLVNDGTFTANGNTTTFGGSSDQQISGSATTTFFNVTQTNNNTVSLSSHNIIIANDLNLADGTLDDGGNTITLQGNMIHDGIHTTLATGGEGIVFAGSSQQQITRSAAGNSTFGKLTINNSNGVRIPDNNGYNFTIDNALRLSSGVFDIGSSLMLIEADATIDEVSPFGASNMIQTNSSFTDNGLQRNFNAIGSLTSLMFPVGQSKYTPVEFSITSSDAGSLTVRPANEMHPSVINDSETPEIVDADNVLQYHWIVKAANLTNFSATATMTYEQADVTTVDYNEDRYIPARLYESDAFWDKSLDSTNVDEINNTITFPFSNVADANITGDYTAGFPDAIPDQVPTYETTGTGGDYTASATWNAVTAGAPPVTPGVGPIGSIIIVRDGDVLTFDQNSIRAYRTTIETGGVLEVDDTFGHSLGTVSGGGDIRIISDDNSAVLPAGFYIDFFNCSGGGLEYGGTGSYNIEGGLTELRNLTLSGSGDRNLPNNAITICNDFTINGSTFNNPNNQAITVQNDFLQSGGTFNNGSGTLSITNNLDISGGTFNAGTGTKTVNGALNLTSSGTVNVGSAGTFTVQSNVTNTGTFDGGSGSAIFALGGSTVQTITGDFTGTATFHRLEVNNASGISFGGNAEVSTELRLTNGVINNGANTFTLAQNAVVTPTGGSSSSYLTGAITKNSISMGTSFRFPLGKGNRYSPTTVSGVMTAGQDWTAEYFTTNQNDRTSFDVGSGPTVLSEIANDMWRITSSGDNEATIGITWNASSGVPDPSDVRVVYWDDKASPSYTTADNDAAENRWETKGATSVSGTASSGSVTSASPLPFSTTDISFGTATTPLPVELISFTAEMDGRVALLQWETASERNNDFFEIQRSINGQDWTSLGVVEGAGDSDVPLSYDYKDGQPILGVSYYRLRQVDYDGRFEYSDVISLENVGNALGLPEPEILLYPNPGQIEQVHVRVLHLKPFEEVQLSLADAYGRQFMQESISPEDLEAGYKLQSDRDLPAGMYVVSVKQGAIQLQKKLIIRKY